MISTSCPSSVRFLARPSVRWTLPLGLGTKKLLTIAIRTAPSTPFRAGRGRVELGDVEGGRSEPPGELELVLLVADVGDRGAVRRAERGQALRVAGGEHVE